MIAGVICILLFLVLFWRVPHVPAGTRASSHVSLMELSIIIPARNEERTIGTLLKSIRTQPVQPLEIIVIDDHSTDRTREEAEKYGVMVVDNPELPSHWMGKSWACWNGAQAAKGKIFLFADSDTWFEKDGLSKVMETFSSNKKNGFWTIHPFHKMLSFYEKLSSVFHLVIYSSAGITSIFSSKIPKSSGGFGQCMICSRDAYFETGGHEAIKEQIVENFSLIKWAVSRGYPAFAISGKSILNMRMYNGGLPSVIFGWGKSFASGSKLTGPGQLILIIAWIAFSFSFLAHSADTASQEPFAFCLIYLVISLLLYRTLKKIGNFTFGDALLFPLHLVFFIFVFVYSLISTFVLRNASWKGRKIAGKGKG